MVSLIVLDVVHEGNNKYTVSPNLYDEREEYKHLWWVSRPIKIISYVGFDPQQYTEICNWNWGDGIIEHYTSFYYHSPDTIVVYGYSIGYHTYTPGQIYTMSYNVLGPIQGLCVSDPEMGSSRLCYTAPMPIGSYQTSVDLRFFNSDVFDGLVRITDENVTKDMSTGFGSYTLNGDKKLPTILRIECINAYQYDKMTVDFGTTGTKTSLTKDKWNPLYVTYNFPVETNGNQTITVTLKNKDEEKDDVVLTHDVYIYPQNICPDPSMDIDTLEWGDTLIFTVKDTTNVVSCVWYSKLPVVSYTLSEDITCSMNTRPQDRYGNLVGPGESNNIFCDITYTDGVTVSYTTDPILLHTSTVFDNMFIDNCKADRFATNGEVVELTYNGPVDLDTDTLDIKSVNWYDNDGMLFASYTYSKWAPSIPTQYLTIDVDETNKEQSVVPYNIPIDIGFTWNSWKIYTFRYNIPTIYVGLNDKAILYETSGGLGKTIKFSCGFTNSILIDSYEWDFGDMTATSGEVNPTHEYATTGVYTASLKFITSNGYEYTYTRDVTTILYSGWKVELLGICGHSSDNKYIVTTNATALSYVAYITYKWFIPNTDNVDITRILTVNDQDIDVSDIELDTDGYAHYPYTFTSIYPYKFYNIKFTMYYKNDLDHYKSDYKEGVFRLASPYVTSDGYAAIKISAKGLIQLNSLTIYDSTHNVAIEWSEDNKYYKAGVLINSVIIITATATGYNIPVETVNITAAHEHYETSITLNATVVEPDEPPDIAPIIPNNAPVYEIAPVTDDVSAGKKITITVPSHINNPHFNMGDNSPIQYGHIVTYTYPNYGTYTITYYWDD